MVDRPEYLTEAEVCERYSGNVTRSTLTNWRYRKTGPSYVKLCGKILYPLADLIAWEEANKKGAPKKEPVV